jgi:hypothetical protein
METPRKQILIAVAGGVLVAVLSAAVAYRRGAEKSKSPAFSSSMQQSDESSQAGQPSQAGCVDFHRAGRHTGENGCVSGRVLRVYTSRGGNTFLDFCQDYRSCPFTSIIFASDRPNFGNLGALEGRQIEILGEIVTYQGRAEIVIHTADQIRAIP